MRRREIDGCPIAGALQMIGDKWTMLIIRNLAHGPRRTMVIHADLEPISSRTLVGRLQDLVKDRVLDRKDFGGNPPHIEYALTKRGRLLLPLLDALREVGETLGCNECEDRRKIRGDYCETCPNKVSVSEDVSDIPQDQPLSPPVRRRREHDDSIVLL